MTISVKQIVKIFIGLLVLIWLFFYFFIYFDFENKCYVKITPSIFEFSNTTIKRGIKYLKNNYKPQYEDFCKYVKTIEPNIGCGGYGGGCFYGSSPGVVYISTTYGKVKNAAKVIIHETCHAKQFAEKRPMSEAECYGKDVIIPWEGPSQKSIHQK
jgi:hypothetical protein